MAKVKFKTPKENRIQRSVTPYIVIIATILSIYAISLIVPLLLGLTISFKANDDYNQAFSLFSFPNLSAWAIDKAENTRLYAQLVSGANLPFLEELGYHIDIFAFPNLGYEHLFGNYVNFFVRSGNAVKDTFSYYIGWNMNIKKTVAINPTFLDFCWNTLLYAGVQGLLTTMCPCIMGYLCARFPSKFASFLYAFVVVVLTLPIVGTGAATLTLMQRLSLHDTFWGIWIRSATFMNTYFLIFFAFFKSIPGTYSEAAEIDGAGHFRIMWTIYIPFAIKMISTAYLLLFVTAYNSYNINLIHLRSRPTLAYAAWKMSQSPQITAPGKIAACYILSLPMFIFFIAFKNKLMGNMTIGGLKG
jgi:multiple sugar transport system permease protein